VTSDERHGISLCAAVLTRSSTKSAGAKYRCECALGSSDANRAYRQNRLRDRELSSAPGESGMVIGILLLCVVLLLASAVERPAPPENSKTN